MEGTIIDGHAEHVKALKQVEEITLIKGAIKGEQRDFLALINNYKSYLYKTAFLYVKNNEDAIDIYQETVYKAYLNIGKLKNPMYFKTWMTRILINNAKDKIAELATEDRYVEIEKCMDKVEESREVSLDEKIDLYNAIDSLEEKYRTPIILNYFQGLTTKEIAQILETPENSIKSYIRRGKAALYKTLREGE
ncbi:MAG: sigma-70 family RNA polymerase sigma factor [Clostridium sp.]